MGIKLKKILRKNPLDRSKSQWYLIQQSSGSVELDQIAKEIAARSSLSYGDVQSVLSNLVDCLPTFLKLGQSIRIQGFGTFHVSVTSEGSDRAEDVTARNIRTVKLRFLPSNTLKRHLSEATFEIVETTEG